MYTSSIRSCTQGVYILVLCFNNNAAKIVSNVLNLAHYVYINVYKVGGPPPFEEKTCIHRCKHRFSYKYQAEHSNKTRLFECIHRCIHPKKAMYTCMHTCKHRPEGVFGHVAILCTHQCIQSPEIAPGHVAILCKHCLFTTMYT